MLPFLTSHAREEQAGPTRGPPWHTAHASVTGKAAAPLRQLPGHKKPLQDILPAPGWLPLPPPGSRGGRACRWLSFSPLLSLFKQIHPHMLLGPASVQDRHSARAELVRGAQSLSPPPCRQRGSEWWLKARPWIRITIPAPAPQLHECATLDGPLSLSVPYRSDARKSSYLVSASQGCDEHERRRHASVSGT